ncbi:hypothetical protein [Microbacterium kribbense]|uniref:hypothetical protein n=1 Tax=Microbacterium kribbense TaxID=433645 RepID=UPI0031D34AF9
MPDGDIVQIDGLRVTSLERTVYDATREFSLEAAVVAFDAALRKVAWNGQDNTYDVARAEEFRASVVRRIHEHPGARGIRQARVTASFADGRADGPGKSLSRLWMWLLGVAEPELQYRVELGGGRYALLDFAWPELRRWAEFDGDVKYTDPQMLAERSVDEVLADQRMREIKVRRATGWDVDRWGFDRMPDIEEFARWLRSIGLYGG